MIPFDDASFSSWRLASRQAIDSGRHDAGGGFSNWACFKAQQAAEFALKSLIRGLGLPALGPSLLQLRRQIEKEGIAVPAEIQADLLFLEPLYLATRNPDAQPNGRPDQAYDAATAARALVAGERVLAHCEAVRAEIERGGESTGSPESRAGSTSDVASSRPCESSPGEPSRRSGPAPSS